MDRREEFNRFNVDLRAVMLKQNDRSVYGEVIDFSRNGLKLVFDEFNQRKNSSINIKIAKPNSTIFISANGRVAWKRNVGGKCEVGLKLCNLPREAKAEILDYAYKNWRKKNSPPKKS